MVRSQTPHGQMLSMQLEYFFDVDNVPPWDIWVGYTDGALLTWVPTALIEAAQMGIDANPEQCIHWAD